MNIVDALAKMFNPQSGDETIALLILTLGSFLLGILLFWLIFSLPKALAARRRIKILEQDLEKITKDHKEIQEEHKVATARIENLESDLARSQNELALQVSKNVGTANELELANTRLYQAQKQEANAKDEYNELKRLYKYAQIAITESEKIAEIAQIGQKQLQLQLDQARLQTNQHELDRKQAADQAVQLQQQAEQSRERISQLEQQLERTESELQQHRNLVAILQPKVDQANQWHSQVEQLQQQLQQLQQSAQQAQNQLHNYTDKEQKEQAREQQDSQLMQQYLAQAEINMNGNPFFDTIDKSELIEDEALLQENLQKLDEKAKAHTEIFAEEIHLLTEEDHERFARLTEQANDAMLMPGFYGEIDPSTFVIHRDDDDDRPVDDDERIARMIEIAEANLATSPLHNPIPTEELIEDPAALARNLANMPQLEDDTIEVIVVPSEEESLQMQKALDYAQLALQAEGFYTTIAPEKLIETPAANANNTSSIVIDPKYKTEIERSVVSDLHRIGAPRPVDGRRDDLKQINGIGTFIEQKLHHFGIYTIEQISRFDDAFIARLTAAIGFAEDAIQRDQWVQQAKDILGSR